ncbi:MAG: polymer-forming cytoskeletal protein [Candidatus Aminicenantes bacterium]|nr:MAG: polymer-forming cytoskeletal protein [Candidatus Aminicenantes bacterium]
MVFKAGKKDRDDRIKQEPFVTPGAGPSGSVSLSASFIGETMNVEGDLTSDEDITIEGKVQGNISVSKTLTIGKSGRVKADITAAVVRVIGEAKGNIIASDKVEILAQGRYTGNIQSQKLVVAEGAILNGYINQENPENKK